MRCMSYINIRMQMKIFFRNLDLNSITLFETDIDCIFQFIIFAGEQCKLVDDMG